MEYPELIEEIRSTGITCVYGSFESEVSPPFSTLVYTNDNDLIADNQNYKNIGNYQLELYSNYKEPDIESLIENKLKELSLPYRKFEEYIDSENLRQVVYEFQLTGG